MSNDLFRDDGAQAWILALVLLCVLVVYLPYVGRGFVTDDFIWLRESVHDGRIDLPRLFGTTTGFFRPLVGLSFGLQFLLHGTDPRAYGLFNMLLHLLNVILVFLLLRRWERTRPLAAWGAALFALNLKAAGMAVGWISGRSELLFSFFFAVVVLDLLEYKEGSPCLFASGALFFMRNPLSGGAALQGNRGRRPAFCLPFCLSE